LWSPRYPHLYDLVIELLDASGRTLDRAESYAGLRSVAIDGKRVKINGEADLSAAGARPGLLPGRRDDRPDRRGARARHRTEPCRRVQRRATAPKGLRGALFVPRDRLGYLLWGEFADWGCGGYGPSHDHQQPGITYVAQWLEVLERDYSHPCIIGWCPLNETAQTFHDRITVLDDATRALFLATKAMDTSRPVLDTSGYAHRVPESDVYDSHDYIERKTSPRGWKSSASVIRAAWTAACSPTHMAARPVPTRGPGPSRIAGSRISSVSAAASSGTRTPESRRLPKPVQPQNELGLRLRPRRPEDFYRRFEAVCDILLDNPDHFGYCYTQLTDIYPEENGSSFSTVAPSSTRRAFAPSAAPRRHRTNGGLTRPARVEQHGFQPVAEPWLSTIDTPLRPVLP
jgi:hypothetical protein